MTIIWIVTLVYYFSKKEQYMGVLTWTPVPAVIIENTSQTITTRKDSDYEGTQYSTARIGSVTYTYFVDDIEHIGTEASPNDIHLPKDFNTESLLAYYNPKNPDTAVLIREEYNGGMALRFIIITPLLLLCVMIIRYNLLNAS